MRTIFATVILPTAIGALFAASLVAFMPLAAELLAQNLLWIVPLVVAGGIGLFLSRAPTHLRLRCLAFVCLLGSVALSAAVGIILFPIELGNGKRIDPPPVAPARDELMERLAAPWNAASGSCPAVALDMARFANMAYETPGYWKKTLSTLGFTDHVAVDQGSAKAVVMIVRDIAVVAFQGTDDMGDWLANLNTAIAPPPDYPVHAGFLKEYRSVSPQVRDALQTNKVRKVWITGHSLGGAMSVLCALDLIEKGDFEVRGVITFGQPLLLKPSFAVKANERLAGLHLRFTNQDDIVPRVVPGFRGGGSSIWFHDDEVEFSTPRMFSNVTGPFDSSSMESDDEGGPPPLTPREFELEKLRIRFERQGMVSETENSQAYAALPSSKEHPMTLYLAAIEKHLGKPPLERVVPPREQPPRRRLQLRKNAHVHMLPHIATYRSGR